MKLLTTGLALSAAVYAADDDFRAVNSDRSICRKLKSSFDCGTDSPRCSWNGKKCIPTADKLAEESAPKTCRKILHKNQCEEETSVMCKWKRDEGVCRPTDLLSPYEVCKKTKNLAACRADENCFVNTVNRCRPNELAKVDIDCGVVAAEGSCSDDPHCMIKDGECVANCTSFDNTQRNECLRYNYCEWGKAMGTLEDGATCMFPEDNSARCDAMPRDQCRNTRNQGKLERHMYCFYNRDDDSCIPISDCPGYPKKPWCNKMSKFFCYWHEVEGCLPIPEDATRDEILFEILGWEAYEEGTYGKAYKFRNGKNGWSDFECEYRDVPEYLKGALYLTSPKRIEVGKSLNVTYQPRTAEGWVYVMMPRAPKKKSGKDAVSLGWEDGDQMRAFGFELDHDSGYGRDGEWGFRYDRIKDGAVKASYYRRIFKKRLDTASIGGDPSCDPDNIRGPVCRGMIEFGSGAGLPLVAPLSITIAIMLDDMAKLKLDME